MLLICIALKKHKAKPTPTLRSRHFAEAVLHRFCAATTCTNNHYERTFRITGDTAEVCLLRLRLLQFHLATGHSVTVTWMTWFCQKHVPQKFKHKPPSACTEVQYEPTYSVHFNDVPTSALLCHLVFVPPHSEWPQMLWTETSTESCQGGDRSVKEKALAGLTVASQSYTGSARWQSVDCYWFDWAVWVRGCWQCCSGTSHFPVSNTEEKITSCQSFPHFAPPHPFSHLCHTGIYRIGWISPTWILLSTLCHFHTSDVSKTLWRGGQLIHCHAYVP